MGRRTWVLGGASAAAAVALLVVGMLSAEVAGASLRHGGNVASPATVAGTLSIGGTDRVITGSPAYAPNDTRAGAPYPLSTQNITLTDTSRPTPDRGDVPGHPGRTMRVLVLTPAGAEGPLPLVVFAHGYNSEPETYAALLDEWAAAGYVVVAPEFPGSAANLPGAPTESDIANQALDMSFVITAMLQGAAGQSVTVDPSRIAVAGHSDGGSTVATLALDATYSDPRIDAFMVLSGAIPAGVDGAWGGGNANTSLLCVVGTADEYGNLGATTNVFDSSSQSTALITVPGGDHIDTYLADTPAAQDVRLATVRYLELSLATPGSRSGSGQLAAALTLPVKDTSYTVTPG